MSASPLVEIKKNVFLKLENYLPTNSHKFRLAQAFIKEAKKLNFKKITVGSCGNYGYAIAVLAKIHKIQFVIFVPKKYNNLSLKRLKTFAPDNVVEEGYTYEEAVQKSIEFSKNNPSYYNANCVSKNDYILQKAYKGLSSEIEKYFKNNLTNVCVWLPIGNGTTFVSLFRALSNDIKFSLFGLVGSANNSSPIKSILKNKPVYINPKKLTETIYNEPLVNYKPVYNTNQIIKLAKNNIILEATDSELVQASQDLKTKYGYKASPYGCAGFAGFLKRKKDLKQFKHLIIITG